MGLKTYLITLTVGLISICAQAQSSKYKCMVQMSNYIGEGAYIAVSLINPQGGYEKTLYILGADKKWYNSLTEWHKFNSKKPSNISAITGASMSGGDRSTLVVEIEDAKIEKGYRLRFESAVENQKYHALDVDVPLTSEALNGKTEGKGFIRFVRFIKS